MNFKKLLLNCFYCTTLLFVFGCGVDNFKYQGKYLNKTDLLKYGTSGIRIHTRILHSMPTDFPQDYMTYQIYLNGDKIDDSMLATCVEHPQFRKKIFLPIKPGSYNLSGTCKVLWDTKKILNKKVTINRGEVVDIYVTSHMKKPGYREKYDDNRKRYVKYWHNAPACGTYKMSVKEGSSL